MCIRDRPQAGDGSGRRACTEEDHRGHAPLTLHSEQVAVVDVDPGVEELCLLYTSDAADERSSVDLGGRRIIKKKKKQEQRQRRHM